MPPDAPLARPALLLSFIVLSLALIWFHLGDVPLSGRSEGRYAVVSMNMAHGSSWLVPQFRGRPHLTKPPLTYWLEAGALRLLGHGELAVRLPSAIAGSLTFFLLLWFARRVGGWALGVLAAGVLAVMPMHVAISRLTLTDALLGLFWFATLAFGYLAVESESQSDGNSKSSTNTRGGFAALMWLSVALGLLTKGPLAWVPVGLLLLWLALGRRLRQARALHLPAGLLLSLLPLLLWVVLVWHFHPQALEIWYREMVKRAVGSGDHAEPIWYFVPLFLGGLFPATLMMDLPGLGHPWRIARDAFRRGAPACLWALAVVVPFVMFSLIRGKLPSYLLPLCPPMALLAAGTLRRWLSGEADHPAPGVRPPQIVLPLLVVAALALLAGAAMLPKYLGLPSLLWLLPLGVLLIVAIYAWRSWRSRPTRRGNALAALFIALALVWLSGLEMWTALGTSTSSAAMLRQIQTRTGLDAPLRLILFRSADTALTFYNRRPVPTVDLNDLPAWVAVHPADLVMITKENDWKKLVQSRPEVAGLFSLEMIWPGGLGRSARLVFRPAEPAATPSTQPDPNVSALESDESPTN